MQTKPVYKPGAAINVSVREGDEEQDLVNAGYAKFHLLQLPCLTRLSHSADLTISIGPSRVLVIRHNTLWRYSVPQQAPLEFPYSLEPLKPTSPQMQ